MPDSSSRLMKTPKIQARGASKCIYIKLTMHSLARRACTQLSPLPLNSGMNLKNENQTMTPAAPFRAIVVSDQPLPKNSKIKASLTTIAPEKLTDSQVRIRVEYSAINYKDVLAVQAHPGVAKKLPLIPGIDAAGTVVESNDDQFNPRPSTDCPREVRH